MTTQWERHARYNGCEHIFVTREWEGRWQFRVHYGNVTTACGWENEVLRSDTLRDALQKARAHYPSFPVFRRYLGRIEGRDDYKQLA
jgi:hypothetical protein